MIRGVMVCRVWWPFIFANNLTAYGGSKVLKQPRRAMEKNHTIGQTCSLQRVRVSKLDLELTSLLSGMKRSVPSDPHHRNTRHHNPERAPKTSVSSITSQFLS